ncbi:FAD binding domain-containing protein [Thermodesulfobacteriota bacterium]
MTLPNTEYFAPESIEEAVKLLTEKGDGAHILAGGTDLLVKMNHGLLKPKNIIGLKSIKGLKDIYFNKDTGLTIGATALLVEVASHEMIKKHYPAVAYAANETANTQIRNMGTVAGNLCNAAPSADNAPTLIAMEAEVNMVGIEGERRLPLGQFFKGPGLTAMKPGEIMTSIVVPFPSKGSGASYKHISARGKVDISAVCVGAVVKMEGKECKDVKIVLGAVAPTPIRAVEAEAVLKGKKWTENAVKEAGVKASVESRPISDVRSNAEYRKKMVSVLTSRALIEAHERAMKK